MNDYLKVRIKTTKKTDILLKLNKLNVAIKNVLYENKAVTFLISPEDLKRIRKYLVSAEVEVIGVEGVSKLKKVIRKNSLFLVSIVFGVVVFLVLSRVIIQVNVVHENSQLRTIIREALEEEGVTSLSFKKSYQEYEDIIAKIKEQYKDKIEWLEIDVEGMIINVRVEERIINDYDKDYQTCHIVASKSGVIKSILTEKGVSEVKINDFVNKDDILINGMIKLNEEVKENVCASGKVYAEVWYNVKASVPIEKEEEELTGKMRFNLMVKTNNKEYVVLKSRVKEKKVKNIRLFKIFGLEFYIQKEYEVKIKTRKYTEEEALKIAQNLIYEKLTLKGDVISDIINEKVLDKEILNNSLNVEMFIAIKEQIGVRKYYNVEMDSGTDDKKYNGDNN